MNTQETFRQAAQARKRKKEEKKSPNSPNVQNMTMREAFDRGRQLNPNSPIVRVIKRVNQAQAVEINRQKEEKRFVQLRKKYNSLGRMWYETKIDQFAGIHNRHNRIPIEQKRKQWTQALTSLRDKPSEQRLELLGEMASGMRLIEDHVSRVYGDFFSQAVVDNDSPFGSLRDEWPGVSFTVRSILFIEAINDISGHSKEQKKEFREFMTKDAGLKGKIGLLQLLPGINRWIDHSNSRFPSHSSNA